MPVFKPVDVYAASATAGMHDNRVEETQQRDDAFAEVFNQAKEKLNQVAQKLVASALLIPLMQQMRDDPFKSEMFHGGFGEDVFMQQLDTRLADRIAAHTGIPLVNTLTEHFTRWLKDHPQQIERAAQSRIDTLG